MGIAVGIHASAAGAGVTTLSTPSRTSAASASTFEISGSSDVAPLTVVDSFLNIYTQIGTPQATSSGGLAWKWRCENASGGASHTATATWLAADTPVVILLEVTGAAAASLDTSNQAQDNSSPYTVSTGTLGQANELVSCTIHGNGSTNPATFAESTGFTIQEQQTDNSSYDAAAMATKIVAATTAVVPSFTCSGSTSGALKISSYKEAAAGTPPVLKDWRPVMMPILAR